MSALSIPAISFRFRSPYEFQASTPGLPPAGAPKGGAPLRFVAPITEANPYGTTSVAGRVLTPYTSNTPGPNQNQAVVATFDQGAYGDIQTAFVNFPGAGLPQDGAGNNILVVLPRPTQQRTQLLIQNNTIGKLYYAFDRTADSVSSVYIAAGGSREFDQRIPQGNLSLYSLAAGNAVIEYMNNNVT